MDTVKDGAIPHITSRHMPDNLASDKPRCCTSTGEKKKKNPRNDGDVPSGQFKYVVRTYYELNPEGPLTGTLESSVTKLRLSEDPPCSILLVLCRDQGNLIYNSANFITFVYYRLESD